MTCAWLGGAHNTGGGALDVSLLQLTILYINIRVNWRTVAMVKVARQISVGGRSLEYVLIISIIGQMYCTSQREEGYMMMV
jgi:hypothetical protein